MTGAPYVTLRHAIRYLRLRYAALRHATLRYATLYTTVRHVTCVLSWTCMHTHLPTWWYITSQLLCTPVQYLSHPHLFPHNFTMDRMPCPPSSILFSDLLSFLPVSYTRRQLYSALTKVPLSIFSRSSLTPSCIRSLALSLHISLPLSPSLYRPQSQMCYPLPNYFKLGRLVSPATSKTSSSCNVWQQHDRESPTLLLAGLSWEVLAKPAMTLSQ